MPKEKINVVIDGVTYKNIDVYNWNGKYDISTTGVAQIIKQFVKNNYGDIKVWGKSDSYSGGSSVNIYLWNVPQEWYKKVDEFADRFGMYHEYDGGDGYWRGKSVGAYDEKGNPIGNSSPYMHVYNKPPYGAKEEDMTPPNYEEQPKPKKKEFERKGAKFSPTDNLDLILDCGNGWKIYVGKPKEKYLYNVVKDKDTKQNKEQWAEIKADMLEAGFQWGYKSGTFQRWTTKPDDTLPQQACNVLSKYWASSSQPKKETPKEDSEDIVLFREGQRIVLVQDDLRTTNLKKGMKGTILYDIYEGMDYSDVVFDDLGESRLVKTNIIKKIENEAIPNEEPKEVLPFEIGEVVELIEPFYYNNVLYPQDYIGQVTSVAGNEAYVDFGEGFSIPVPFDYLKKFVPKEKTPKEEPKESKEFKIGDKVRLIKDIDKRYYPNNQELELGDIGIIKNDEGGLGIYFDVEFNGKEIYLGSSYLQLVQDEMPKQEIDLDTYISDLNMLLEMEEDADKRIELTIYINDLNTLKLLE